MTLFKLSQVVSIRSLVSSGAPRTEVSSSLALRCASLLIFSALALTGCFHPTGHDINQLNGKNAEDAGEAMATFTIQPVKGSSIVASTDPVYFWPTSRLYNLTVCVQDRRSGDSLRGAKFSIEGGEKAQAVMADVQGCLNWSETIKFKFLSKEIYLPIYRRVRATGIQSGSRRIKFAIDPWNHSGKASDVVDLTQGTLPAAYLAKDEDAQAYLNGEGPLATQARPSFWPGDTKIGNSILPRTAESVRALGARPVGGVDRHFEIRTSTPQIMLKDLQNSNAAYNLPAAHIKLSLAIVAPIPSNDGGTKFFSIYQTSAPIDMVNEALDLRAFVDAHLDFASGSGNLFVAMKFEPIDSAAGFVGFESFAEAGSSSSLLNNGNFNLTERASSLSSGFAYDSFIAQLIPVTAPIAASPSASAPTSSPSTVITPNPNVSNPTLALKPSPTGSGTAVDLPSGISRLSAYRMGLILVTNAVVAPGETSTHRKILFRAQVCLTDVANGNKPATDVDFSVTKTNGQKIVVRSMVEAGLEGCIRWNEEISHNYYAPEQFKAVPISIDHAPDFHEERKILLNPWSTSSGFGRDEKEDAPIVQMMNEREPIASRVLVDSFGFDTVDTRDYKVDEFMNLVITKRLRLRIKTRAQRFSNIVNGRGSYSEPLRDGVWLLRAGIYAPVKDITGQDFELISAMSGRSRLVRVRGGEAKIDADFSISDSRFTRARANLVFEILPVDEDKLTASERSTLNLEHANPEELIDHAANLVTPTFFGPLWVKDENGGAAVFPTDDLLADPRPDDPSWKSVARPYADLTLPKLFAKLDAQKAAQNEQARKKASLTTYLKTNNLEYVALNNEAYLMAQSPMLAQNNKALPSAGGLKQFVDAMNGKYQTWPAKSVKGNMIRWFTHKITSQDIMDLIDGKREIDGNLASRLCFYFISEQPNLLAPDHEFASDSEFLADTANNCAAGWSPGSGSKYFVMQRLIRTLAVGDSKYIGGRTMALTVGAGVDFSRSQSIGYSASFNPVKIVEAFVPQLAVLDSALGISVSASRSSSKSTSESSALSTGTGLNLETAEVEVGLNKYERCITLRASPEFWNGYGLKQKIMFDRYGASRKMTPEEKVSILGRGVMICTGAVESTPIKVRERYYSLAQGPFDKTQLDDGDLRNHPWLLSLRGDSDYAQLMSLLKAQHSVADVPAKDDIDPATMPLDRLAAAYAGYSSTTQGMYEWDKRKGTPVIIRSADH